MHVNITNNAWFVLQVPVSQWKPGAPRGQDREHHCGNTACLGREILPPHTHILSVNPLWCDVQTVLIRLHWAVALWDEAYWLSTGMWAWLNHLLCHRRCILTLWFTHAGYLFKRCASEKIKKRPSFTLFIWQEPGLQTKEKYKRTEDRFYRIGKCYMCVCKQRHWNIMFRLNAYTDGACSKRQLTKRWWDVLSHSLFYLISNKTG